MEKIACHLLGEEQTVAMVGKLLENKKRRPGAQPQDVKMPAILSKDHQVNWSS